MASVTLPWILVWLQTGRPVLSCGTAAPFLRLTLYFFPLLLVFPITSNALSTTYKLESGDRNMHLDLYVNWTFCCFAAESEILRDIQPSLLKPPI